MTLALRLLLHIGLITPITSYAPESHVTSETTLPSTNQAQQATAIINPPTDVASTFAACPATAQQLTLKFRPILTSLAGITGLTGATYIHDRSILVAHEGGHFVAGALAGYKPTKFYVNPKFWGEGYVSYSTVKGPVSNILVSIAGPLGGIAAYMAWLKLWNILMRYWKTGNAKESVLQGIKDPIFNEDASAWAIGGSFLGSSLHWLGNMVPSSINPINKLIPTFMIPGGRLLKDNDADAIRHALAQIAPLLAKAYPLLAYAGFAGLIGYGAYGVYVTCKAKKSAGKPLW